MLLGDSWTHIMWDIKVYRDVFHQFGFGDILERGNNTAIGGTTAAYWAQPQNLAVVQNELIQNPTLDIVVLSIGGNDMLAGILNGGWHTGLSPAAETALLDAIEANMQTIVNGIKAVRPDIEIVFSGYDYINLVETVINNPSGPNALLWANLGQPNAEQINTAFVKLEQRKINIANADPRVHYVNATGLMQYVYGYPGIFPAFFVPAPGLTPPHYHPFPGGNITFPTPPVALADNGNDAIHLSNDGYRHLVINQVVGYFLNKFRGNFNASFRSEGGSNDGWIRSDGATGTGNVRVGDMGSNHLYRGIISFNTAAIPDNAIITGASIYLNRESLSGNNPFAGNNWGSPVIDIKNGTFGAAGIEIGDFLANPDASNVGCFIGTCPKNGYTIRIDLQPSGYQHINKTGRTQFRLTFQIAHGSSNDYVQFHNGDQPGLLAPYMDVFYTLPPSPPTASVNGNITVCHGAPVNIPVNLTGTPPWSLTWSDGLVENNIQTTPHVRTVYPTSNVQFALSAVSDAYFSGSVSGIFTVNVLPPIQVTVTGLSSNYCVNSPATTLTASPPGGTWTGHGITNNHVFDPALAVMNGGGGVVTLNYSGVFNNCHYSKDFTVIVDTASCNLTPSCNFGNVAGNINCVGNTTLIKTFTQSGELWVFEDLIPGRTYTVSTCANCGFDSHVMVRDEDTQSFIAENDDGCGIFSSVTFVAPASGRVGVNVTDKRNFNCNPFNCNPYDCNPYNCNPYPCQPYDCNCQTCYQTCYRDEDNYLPCSNNWEFINGILTSPCIGACTFGGCWRRQFNVPYDCNPYPCNCQTCYNTCYDTCYQTCFDTCYQTCTDKCGTGNNTPCDVTLTCLDCEMPVATITANDYHVCLQESVNFSATISGITCNTIYSWNFGNDAIPATSNHLNPSGIVWTSEGNKQVIFQVEEPGLGIQTYLLNIQVSEKPAGGTLAFSSHYCVGDTARVVVNGVNNATSYQWYFGNGVNAPGGNEQFISVSDTLIDFYVVAMNGACAGDTLRDTISATAAPLAVINIIGSNLICAGDSVELVATGGNSYVWSNGAISSSIKVSPQVSTLYEVTVTGATGCRAVTSAAIMVSNTQVTLSASNDTLFVSDDYVTYQWYVDGVPVPGAVNNFIVARTSGNYQLKLTDTDGCEIWSDVVQIVLTNTISETVYSDFSIYPNPAKTEVYIVFSKENPLRQFELYNVLGEKVISSVDAFNSSPVRIDISEYAAGVYFLKLNRKKVYRLVKQ
jgi:lysophospholipase L1-like esterase